MACDSNTISILHCNGADTSTTITDDAPSSASTWTAQGNAQIDTAQSKFGGASLLLDGTGDYITAPDDAKWRFGGGTGNFTWECWVRFNSLATRNGFFHQSSTGGNGHHFAFNPGTTTIFYDVAASTVVSGSWNPTTGVWYHVALIRGWSGNANDWAITIDGSSVGTATSATTIGDYAFQMAIGRYTDGGLDLYTNGWLDEIRLSDTARWTANFTPSTSEYCASAVRTSDFFQFM